MSACLDRLKLYLGEHGVTYEVEHHREVYTTQEAAAEVHERGRHVAKVFIAEVDGKPVMFVLPAAMHVDLRRIQEHLGATTVRRAREEEFGPLFPDCDLGAMPPFGGLYNVPMYLERILVDEPYLVFQGGSHTETIKVPMADYLRVARPKIANFALEAEPSVAAG